MARNRMVSYKVAQAWVLVVGYILSNTYYILIEYVLFFTFSTLYILYILSIYAIYTNI